jgi:hypothetical protein
LDQPVRQNGKAASIGPAAARPFRPSVPRSVPLALTLLLLAIIATGILTGYYLLPTGPSLMHGGIASRLLTWDGRHYYHIMRFGYTWNPVIGERLGQYQQIAFFPLQPLLDGAMARVTGSQAPALMLLLSLSFGIASIFAFESLAASLLTPSAARWASLFYVIWPACSFFVMGYPTGLISLCIIAALADYTRGRIWRAALWCGIGTAAAPTVVFVVFALCLHRAWLWLRNDRRFAALPAMFAWGCLCVAGLLGFMLYQEIRFHDPLAFNRAQAAWGTAPPFARRLARLFRPGWYGQQMHAGLAEIGHGLKLWPDGVKPALAKIEFGVQRLINSLTGAVALLGIVAATIALRRSTPAIVIAAWTVLAGYLWFIVSTDQNMLAVPRLLAPAIAIFLGLGWLAGRSPGRVASLFGAGLAIILTIVSIAEVAFAVSGYWVV